MIKLRKIFKHLSPKLFRWWYDTSF